MKDVWDEESVGRRHRLVDHALRHLKREADEALAARTLAALSEELADCLLLVFDAARRSGLSYENLRDAALAKLDVNRGRVYGPPDAEGVREHLRCCCEDPEAEVARVSNCCPVHNTHPDPPRSGGCYCQRQAWQCLGPCGGVVLDVEADFCAECLAQVEALLCQDLYEDEDEYRTTVIFDHIFDRELDAIVRGGPKPSERLTCVPVRYLSEVATMIAQRIREGTATWNDIIGEKG